MAFDIFDTNSGKDLYNKLGRYKKHLFNKLLPLLEFLKSTATEKPIELRTHSKRFYRCTATNERYLNLLQKMGILELAESRKGKVRKFSINKQLQFINYGKNPQAENTKELAAQQEQKVQRRFLEYLFTKLELAGMNEQLTHDTLLSVITPNYRKLYLSVLNDYKSRAAKLIE